VYEAAAWPLRQPLEAALLLLGKVPMDSRPSRELLRRGAARTVRAAAHPLSLLMVDAAARQLHQFREVALLLLGVVHMDRRPSRELLERGMVSTMLTAASQHHLVMVKVVAPLLR
jgi:hypothetical protein